MKIAIGTRLRQGPWGGGNQFAAHLTAYLRARGAEVTHQLDRPDLDIILLTEPRRSSPTSAFNDVDVLAYLGRVNPASLVVHRVNECDERKGTRMMNRRLAIANRCADQTIFVSAWLRDMFEQHGYRFVKAVVIRNGADRSVFRPRGVEWNGRDPLKLVTHHWSNHRLKGFDIYTRLDDLLGRPEFASRFSFTYIGRLPDGLELRHTRVLPPLAGPELAGALAEHHVYLTASQNEPGGMHNVEGALCGLPLLYRRSGSVQEYSDGFGVPFDETSFEDALAAIRHDYPMYRARMAEFPLDAERMSAAYLDVFEQLIVQRDRVLAERRWRPGRTLGMRAHASLYDTYYTWRRRFDARRRSHA